MCHSYDTACAACHMSVFGLAQVYDSGNGLLAPRIWWCLMYHGHPAPLILDGGYAKWVEEGRTTDLAEPCPLTASPDLQQWHTGCQTGQKPTSKAQEPTASAQLQYKRVQRLGALQFSTCYTSVIAVQSCYLLHPSCVIIAYCMVGFMP